MIHFVRSGPSFVARHLDPLIRYFVDQAIPFEVHDQPPADEQLAEADAYVTCDPEAIRRMKAAKTPCYAALVPHSWTGLKGPDYRRCGADLYLLPGRHQLAPHGLELDNHRYVLAGCPTWDRVVQYRESANDLRPHLLEKLGLEPETRMTVFHPTAPNDRLVSNLHRTKRLFQRVGDALPDWHFVLSLHPRMREIAELNATLDELGELAAAQERFHLAEEELALTLAVCADLYVTDISGLALVPVAMKRPLLFLRIRMVGRKNSAHLRKFQAGPLLRDVKDLASFVADYETPEAMDKVLASCIEHDDQTNCLNTARQLFSCYDGWLQRLGGQSP